MASWNGKSSLYGTTFPYSILYPHNHGTHYMYLACKKVFDICPLQNPCNPVLFLYHESLVKVLSLLV